MHDDVGGEPGLVANYRFDEADGDTVFNQGSAGSAANITISNSNHFRRGETDFINFDDVLSANADDLNATGIAASYDSAKGLLTLSNPEGGTAEEFQQVLRGVSFSNTSDAPDYRPRTVKASTKNSQGTVSEHDTASFTINRSNDTISFDGIETLNYTENQAATSSSQMVRSSMLTAASTSMVAFFKLSFFPAVRPQINSQS